MIYSEKQYKETECNFHILRYCKAQYEIHKWESIHEFMNYLLCLRDKVDIYELEGKTVFSSEEYKENFNPNKKKYSHFNY